MNHGCKILLVGSSESAISNHFLAARVFPAHILCINLCDGDALKALQELGSSLAKFLNISQYASNHRWNFRYSTKLLLFCRTDNNHITSRVLPVACTLSYIYIYIYILRRPSPLMISQKGSFGIAHYNHCTTYCTGIIVRPVAFFWKTLTTNTFQNLVIWQILVISSDCKKYGNGKQMGNKRERFSWSRCWTEFQCENAAFSYLLNVPPMMSVVFTRATIHILRSSELWNMYISTQQQQDISISIG